MGLPAFLEDPRLRPYVDRARIDCDKLFEYACPMYWGGLRDLGVPTVRFCEQCRENVYFVSTDDELRDRAARGQCVAVMLEAELPDPSKVPTDPPMEIMGRVAPSVPRMLSSAAHTEPD